MRAGNLNNVLRPSLRTALRSPDNGHDSPSGLLARLFILCYLHKAKLMVDAAARTQRRGREVALREENTQDITAREKEKDKKTRLSQRIKRKRWRKERKIVEKRGHEKYKQKWKKRV